MCLFDVFVKALDAEQLGWPDDGVERDVVLADEVEDLGRWSYQKSFQTSGVLLFLPHLDRGAQVADDGPGTRRTGTCPFGPTLDRHRMPQLRSRVIGWLRRSPLSTWAIEGSAPAGASAPCPCATTRSASGADLARSRVVVPAVSRSSSAARTFGARAGSTTAWRRAGCRSDRTDRRASPRSRRCSTRPT